MLYKLEGIVIRSMDYGENNKIIAIYTRHNGKMSIMVRGAKKMNSRFSSVTQIFTHGEFVLFKTSSMGTLNQSETLESHRKLRENLHMSAYSAYVVELIDRIVPELDANEMMFEQLKASLEAIESNKDPAIVLNIMEMKMLAIAGYLPQLDECVSCNAHDGEMGISITQGGVLCAKCFYKDNQLFRISASTLKMLRLFQRMDLRRLGAIEVKDETKKQLKLIMRAFMDHFIDIRLKARGFLDQMDKYEL
ncbi:DNA repair protein RecO [Paenibacillus psychroresistens]|uniref:DNA repair protein RecO n=1 Tax=Paenibacillus psychroresistens TaxID=1778678 RepID=A0A6B8RGZ0_9BACL|nr:DNA repair protein RecO [Paenibacillus psychroresistens]QGQ95731.1 DNA repair protein RecO [Paenibacillus psychroresistens]